MKIIELLAIPFVMVFLDFLGHYFADLSQILQLGSDEKTENIGELG